MVGLVLFCFVVYGAGPFIYYFKIAVVGASRPVGLVGLALVAVLVVSPLFVLVEEAAPRELLGRHVAVLGHVGLVRPLEEEVAEALELHFLLVLDQGA